MIYLAIIQHLNILFEKFSNLDSLMFTSLCSPVFHDNLRTIQLSDISLNNSHYVLAIKCFFNPLQDSCPN